MMLGFIIVLASAVVSGYFSFREWGVGWGIACGIAGMLVAWIILSLLLRRCVIGRQMEIQNIMQDAQVKVNRQLEIFNRRPPSSMNAARQTLEKIQFDGLRKALDKMDSFKSLYIWNIMLAKQINAMKIQLLYQLREYDKVDLLIPKALMLDPQSICIKLARMYKNDDPKLDRFFQTRCRRFKGDNGAFVASVYAWIKVKQGAADIALDALKNAAKSSDNPVLMENIDRLTNGKVKHFSNSGFGDNWYVLALEEPKMKNPRQSGRPF